MPSHRPDLGGVIYPILFDTRLLLLQTPTQSARRLGGTMSVKYLSPDADGTTPRVERRPAGKYYC